MSRVVYPGGIKQNYGFVAGYILYDIPDKKKLAQLVSETNPHEPKWSPDWSKFIVDSEGDFYLVTRDGVISKITNFNPHHDQLKNDITDTKDASWSPDGRNVAL